MRYKFCWFPTPFPSSDQVGAPLQGCGHLGSYGDHTHAPPRSIYSVPGITINNSIRSHGNTHLQANMVASHLSKNYLFYSNLYCGSALPVCAKLQCSIDAQNFYWLILINFGPPFRALYPDSFCTYEGTKIVWFKQMALLQCESLHVCFSSVAFTIILLLGLELRSKANITVLHL